MADTPKLAFPEISVSQSQKEAAHNESLQMLDFMVMASVIDKDLTAPPGGESEGDCYIVGASATGDWAGHDDDVAQYYNAGWVFYTPNEGWKIWVNDEDVYYFWDGSSWTSPAGDGDVTGPASSGDHNIVVFNGTGGKAIEDSGIAIERNAKITIYPQYPNAVEYADGSNNDPGAEGMTFNSELISNVRRNYAEWSSDNSSALQDKDWIIEIPIPYDFNGFQTGTNQALTIEIKTEENTTTNNKLDVTINRDGQATTSSLTDQKSASADTWETIGFDETDTVLAAVAAGETLIVDLKMYSFNSKYVRIGKVELNIKRK